MPTPCPNSIPLRNRGMSAVELLTSSQYIMNVAASMSPSGWFGRGGMMAFRDRLRGIYEGC